jgi:C-terminal processing protease CtpA/Prc
MMPTIIQRDEHGHRSEARKSSHIGAINGNPIRRIVPPRIYRKIQRKSNQKIENQIENKIGKQIETKFENREIARKIETKIEHRKIESNVFARTRILERNFAIGGPTRTVH